jgi:hypothetical protein
MNENEIDVIISDYLLFFIFIIFLALVIAGSVKLIVWLIMKLGGMKIWPFA